MAKTKKRSSGAGKKHRSNKGRKHHAKRNPGMMGGHRHHRRVRRNAGLRSRFGGVSDLVINGLFVVAGALGSKLLTQMVLGAKNTGILGYGVNLLAGGALWFIVSKGLKNPAAAAGTISGTVVQIIIRLLNDYTPFGQYVANLGMGDYQAQAFLTPQVLVDPYNSATIKWPAGMPMLPAPAAAPAAGVAGLDPLYSGGSSLY